MKQTLKTGLAAFVLLLAISCKKENSIQSSFTSGRSLTSDDISDIDAPANVASVTIGTQVWMKRNLNVIRYRNGDIIPQVRNTSKWDTITTGAWCWYKNDSANGSVYGRLYNWFAVHDPRGLAPKGWHVPSDEEWTTLTTFLGGEGVAGGKMKSTGTIEAGTGLWHAPNTDATNSSGFTALPGGYRNDDTINQQVRSFGGSFYGIGGYGGWWSSTSLGTKSAWYRDLFSDFGYIYRASKFQKNGYSVRCLKN